MRVWLHLPDLTSLSQLIVILLRGLNVCFSKNDSAERNGKQIQPSNYMNTMDLNNLENCDWTCVDWDDWDQVSTV